MIRLLRQALGAECVSMSIEETHTVIGALQDRIKWDEDVGLFVDAAARMTYERRRKLLEALRRRLPRR